MERNRSSKIIAVVALVVAVFGLTLGFAAFSNTLTISSSAYVNPSDENFIIGFSKSTESSNDTGALAGVAVPNDANQPTKPSAGSATLAGTTISGMKANLTTPGDYVTYTFYVHNTGKYDAFLNAVTIGNVANASSPKVCTPVDGTSATLVSSACEAISISISVGDQDGSYTNATDGVLTLKGSVANIANHTLSKDSYETVVVTLSYDSAGTRADGDFNVSFGDLELTYGTVD